VKNGALKKKKPIIVHTAQRFCHVRKEKKQKKKKSINSSLKTLNRKKKSTISPKTQDFAKKK
jgi:hypothetical protein